MKDGNSNNTKIYLIFLCLIFIFGLILRLWNFKENLIFAYDQARDAYRVQRIIKNKDIKIVGPETDIPGVFNGPLFYYLITLPYAFSKGNPNLPTLLMVGINLLGIPLLFYLGTLMFESKRIGILAAFLFASSFQMTSYAQYLSNASPLPITTLIFFLGLWLWLIGKKIGLPLSILGWGLSMQFDLFYIYLIIFYPLIYYLWKPKVEKRSLSYSLLIAAFLCSTFLLAEIKFKFLGINSLLRYFLAQGNREVSFIGTVDAYTNRLVEVLKFNLFSWNSLYALSLFIIAFFYIKHERRKALAKDKSFLFLVLWIFSSAPLFAFSSGVHGGVVINSALPPAFFILFAYFFASLIRKRQLFIFSLILLTIVGGNIFLFLNNQFKSLSVFKISPGLTWENEKEIIDYLYQKSQQKPFSICAVTAPLFVDTTWSYLFEYYGKKKYGYLPFWASFREKPSLGHLPQDKTHPQTRFLIIEGGAIPEIAIRLTRLHEDTISKVIEKKSFEGIVVEKRRLLSKKERERRKMISQKENKKDWFLFEKDPRYSCFF